MSHANTDIFLSLPTTNNDAQQQTVDAVKTYYEALNRQEMGKFFSVIDDNVIHDINQDGTEQGITKFKKFMEASNKSFKEKLDNIVLLVSDDGKYAATRWIDHGKYFKTFPGLGIPARNQSYTLHGGHFFEIKNGKITFVATYYNMHDFMNQIKH